MSELTPAPELVEPATETPTEGAADPAPDDGQQVDASPEPPAPQMYKIGDAEYDGETLTDYIDTAKNAKAMHRSSHDEYTAAKALREEARAIKDDPEIQELKTILMAIKRDGGMSREYDALKRVGSPMAAEVRMEQIESRLATLSEEKGKLEANDVLGQFAAKHEGMTKKQAMAVGKKFLAETNADQFPEGADMLDQLEYFHWKNYGQQGQTDALTAATKAGYDDALTRVKAGQAADLGSPATRSEVPWEPPKDAPPNMLASELAAMEDDSVVFDDDPFR